MPLAGTASLEQTAVGAMLASARDDIDGMTELLLPLTQEELIGLAAYCARFAVGFARRLDAATGDDSITGLRAYARYLAVRAG